MKKPTATLVSRRLAQAATLSLKLAALFFAVLTVLPLVAHGGVTSGTVRAIDAGAGTLTLSTGGNATIYRFHPGVETQILGQRGTVAQVMPGMIVTISSAEPGYATTIAVTGASSADPATKSGASGAAPLNAEKSAYTTLENIVAVIPSTIVIKHGKSWDPLAIKDANDALSAQIRGKMVTLRGKVEAIKPGSASDKTIKVRLSSKVNIRGSALDCQLWFRFSPDQEASIRALRIGNITTLSGRADAIDITDWHEELDLAGAEIFRINVLDATFGR